MPIYTVSINGQEHSFECEQKSVRGHLEKIVRQSGLTTPRQNPQTISLVPQRLVVHGGKVSKRSEMVIDITPPLTRMTEAEFTSESASLLSEVPEEFHGAARQIAWEHGHAYGYEEMILHLGELVSALSPCIEKYKLRWERKQS